MYEHIGSSSGAATTHGSEHIMAVMNRMEQCNGRSQAFFPGTMHPSQAAYAQRRNDEWHSYPGPQAPAQATGIGADTGGRVHAQVNDIDEDTAATYSSLLVIYY